MQRLRAPRRGGWLAAVVLASLATTVALAGESATRAVPLTDQRISEILARPVSLEFQKTPLPEVLRRFEQLLAIPFHLDRAALKEADISPNAPITRKFTRISAQAALALVLHENRLDWCPYRGEFVLVTTPELTGDQLVRRTYDVRGLVENASRHARTPSVSDPLLEFIQHVVDPERWMETAAGPATIKLYWARGVTALAVLNTWKAQQEVRNLLSILRAVRPPVAQVIPRAGATPSPQLAEAIRPPATTAIPLPGEQRIMAALRRRVSVPLKKTPLSAAAGLLARQLEIPVVLDPLSNESEGLRDVKVAFDQGDASGFSILDALVQRYNLDWSIRHEGIFITWAKTAPHITRFYDVRDLTARRTLQGKIAYHADDLVETIVTTVAPDSWEVTRGTGVIVPSPDEAVLAVNQTPSVHRELTAFLEKTRSLRRTPPAEIPLLKQSCPAAGLSGVIPGSPAASSKHSPTPANPRIAELLAALECKATRAAAIAELKDLGLDAAPAVPQLVALLEKRESRIEADLVMSVLAGTGKDAAPALPALLERLQEGIYSPCRMGHTSHRGSIGAAALAGIGEPAVPGLVACLGNKRSSVRADAASALEKIGPEAHRAVPALIGRLHDPDPFVRRCAAWALGKIGSPPEPTAAALSRTIESRNADVRYAAARALVAIRPPPRAAVEAFIRALDNPDGDVQHLAAEALKDLGPEAALAVPALALTLKGTKTYDTYLAKDVPVAETAARALGAIGPPAKSALPALLEVLRNPWTGIGPDGTRLRQAAPVAAARIDPTSDEVLELVARSLDGTAFPRKKVALALALLGRKAEGTVARLVEVARSGWDGALPCACAAVIIQPSNPMAQQQMLKWMPPEPAAFDDEDWWLLHTALQKASAGVRAIPSLIELVRGRQGSDRHHALRALAAFGARAEAAIPLLLELLAEQDAQIRQEAITALQQIASEQSPPLVAAWKDGNPRLRSGVVEVVGHYPAALPLVIESLADHSAQVRLAAFQTLAKIGPRAKPALPQIRKQLDSNFRTLREAAADALTKIGGGSS